MYVYGLCLLFDFATKNLHFATIFNHLVDKCDLRILLISSPVLVNRGKLQEFLEEVDYTCYQGQLICAKKRIITNTKYLFN